MRSYSLSSASQAGTYRISVKQEPHGAASGWLSQRLAAGELLEVAAPRGEFTLDDGAGPVLLAAAGIGVTPVLAMLHQLAAARSEQEVWWLYAARSPAEHPFAAEAHQLLASLPHAREHIYYSAATADERHRAHATTGRLAEDQLTTIGIPTAASAYICGPPSFMTDMRDALTALGVHAANIHTEQFAALTAINPGLTTRPPVTPHQPPGPAESGPQVTFARSGITTAFGSRWRSVLDLADACDVPTRWACRAGVCHTCITPLLSGCYRYDPEPLEPPVDGQVLICCAQPKTDLVLDM